MWTRTERSSTASWSRRATRVRVDPEIARSPNRDVWARMEAEEAERTDRARANR